MMIDNMLFIDVKGTNSCYHMGERQGSLWYSASLSDVREPRGWQERKTL